ncbi:thiaminase II [Paenibacillus segetis]|uniref:Aminopyrimidine aminohydrolase n=1 Tax=Paenibacillus segetis TaxID=1325360 RepID=A0ABQ1Y455_9BACL|nr:thiaminase II [Paenibacillus segetis]GGH10905.1 aminopyrimidine aminohydrolase [Paenibacillus segetis]
MSFTQELRQQADGIFQAIFKHPFVRGIASGDLKKEQLIHYIKQDFEYLNAYMRIYGIAISKCSNREEIAVFNEQISFILHSEIHPHQNFCDVAGVSYEQLQGYPLAPSAHHYIRHMLTIAHEGSLGEIMAVLLPCPWTYQEIGRQLLEEVKPTESHKFYEWMHFYGDSSVLTTTTKFCESLDEWAAGTTELERQKMREHFLLSCQLEYMFWDMAYKLEDWPVRMTAEV